MEGAPFNLDVRILKAEVMETLLYRCVTWTLGKEQFAELRTAHHNHWLPERTKHRPLHAVRQGRHECTIRDR